MCLAELEPCRIQRRLAEASEQRSLPWIGKALSCVVACLASHSSGGLGLVVERLDGETPPAERAELNLVPPPEQLQHRSTDHWGRVSRKRWEVAVVLCHYSTQAFQANRINIMVATDAYGQGIDKPDIDMIFHWEPPLNMEMPLVRACAWTGTVGPPPFLPS